MPSTNLPYLDFTTLFNNYLLSFNELLSLRKQHGGSLGSNILTAATSRRNGNLRLVDLGSETARSKSWRTKNYF